MFKKIVSTPSVKELEFNDYTGKHFNVTDEIKSLLLTFAKEKNITKIIVVSKPVKSKTNQSYEAICYLFKESSNETPRIIVEIFKAPEKQLPTTIHLQNSHWLIY